MNLENHQRKQICMGLNVNYRSDEGVRGVCVSRGHVHMRHTCDVKTCGYNI